MQRPSLSVNSMVTWSGCNVGVHAAVGRVTPVSRSASGSVVGTVGNTSPAALVAVQSYVNACGSKAGSSNGASMLKVTPSPEQAAAGAASQLTVPGTGNVNTSNATRVEV